MRTQCVEEEEDTVCGGVGAETKDFIQSHIRITATHSL